MGQERVAVLVDVLDPHRGDHLAQLPEDDFLGLLFHVGALQSEQADGGVVHHFGCRPDGDGEHAGDVDADVLGRQRPSQRDLDLDRLQVQVVVVLQQRNHERGATVNALHGVPLAHRHPVDNQDAVARTPFETVGEQHHKAEGDDRRKHTHRGEPRQSEESGLVDGGQYKRGHGTVLSQGEGGRKPSRRRGWL